MEGGRVKWFNAQKRFGFIIRDDDLDGHLSDELWFHFNEGEVINAVKGKPEPQFAGKTVGGSGLRDPKEGDRVRFRVCSDNSGREKASPWGYESHYERAKEIIANRPAPKVYRVWESVGGLGETGTTLNPKGGNVIWEGSDMEALMRKYPVVKGHQSPGADPLLPFYSHDDGFEVRRWWEKQLPDGSWGRCPDPRPLSGANRRFERIANG